MDVSEPIEHRRDRGVPRLAVEIWLWLAIPSVLATDLLGRDRCWAAISTACHAVLDYQGVFFLALPAVLYSGLVRLLGGSPLLALAAVAALTAAVQMLLRRRLPERLRIGPFLLLIFAWVAVSYVASLASVSYALGFSATATLKALPAAVAAPFTHSN